MASPRTVTIVALSFALGLFFVFMGTIKLTPRLSKDAYSEMVSITGGKSMHFPKPLFCDAAADVKGFQAGIMSGETLT